MIVGIDIGGANIKACDINGKTYFNYNPLWIKKSVNHALEDIRNSFQTDLAGIVITGELSDAFNTKTEGIKKISFEARTVFKNAFFYGNDEKFHKKTTPPELFFSPNWVASSKFLSKTYPDAIFVDMGTTTTDIIPIVDGKIMAGRTDFERLKKGELIYVGALRTNLSSLIPVVHIDGELPSSPEYFSIIGDALVITGDLNEDEYTCETPDGRGKRREDCLRRIARIVCCDLSELGEDNAVKIAFQAKQRLKEIITRGIRKIFNIYGIDLVIGTGIGEFIIEMATETLDLEYISIGKKYGKGISRVFPAFAVAKLLQDYLEAEV